MTNDFKNMIRQVATQQHILIIIVIVLALLISVVLWGRFELNSFFYPTPPSMPPVVSETTEELLAQFQTVLEKRAPEVLRSLQPGLSENQIFELEKKGGFTLSADLHALYRWRNGSKGYQKVLIPVHRFVPLEEVVANRIAVENDIKKSTFVQRAFGYIFAGHMKTWVHILDDSCGDGYFYDPDRAGSSGVFFYHSMEGMYYVFFPSLQNFLKGAIKCYEQGIFIVKDEGANLDEDYERATKVWNRLGCSTSQ
ncbi:MAG: SMI1/KNR4 family protein [Sedimentisphaerales bacterium]|jgi:cell wall assembly regulator SMI1